MGHWVLGQPYKPIPVELAIAYWGNSFKGMFFRFGIQPRYRGRDLGRRGDSIPETACAIKEKFLYWNASPQKPMHPTDCAHL
ncbi:MAG: hypothetical protein F6J93_09550 [Oscillatoria sp. SIO1A7]|nr:hypothetical protein [Oscillatoria sp. SIO1A7]